jgi:hypothetical protein
MDHRIKRIFQRIALLWIKSVRTGRTQNHTPYEKECLVICRALISKENSKLLMSPISRKRYIKSEDGQIFIIIEASQITIVNHHYSYNINVWGTALEKIVNMFDFEVERRRDIMEKEIRSNVKHSLGAIYKNLIDEKDAR